MSEEKEDYKVHVKGESGEIVSKVIIIGDGGVGKTSLLRKYVKQQFETDYLPTVGVNISKENVNYKGKRFNLLLWDIAGQPQFFLLHKVYYNGADACIIAFDLTASSTFTNVKNWYNELVKYGLEKVPIILVGNKTDLKKDRKIIRPMAENLMDQLGISHLFETSALDGTNVNKMFEKITELLFEYKK